MRSLQLDAIFIGTGDSAPLVSDPTLTPHRTTILASIIRHFNEITFSNNGAIKQIISSAHFGYEELVRE